MNLPVEHPVWLWIYFGGMGTVSFVLLAMILWNRLTIVRDKGQDKAGLMTTLGVVLLFSSGWMMCDVAGPPGNLLSEDIAAHNRFLATSASMAAMAFSIFGLACVLIGYRMLARQRQKESI